MGKKRKKIVGLACALGAMFTAPLPVAKAASWIYGGLGPGTYDYTEEMAIYSSSYYGIPTALSGSGNYVFNTPEKLIFDGSYYDGVQNYVLAPSGVLEVNAKELIIANAVVRDWSWSNDANGLSVSGSQAYINANTTIQNIRSYVPNDTAADTEAFEVRGTGALAQINGNLTMKEISSMTNVNGISVDNYGKAIVTGTTTLVDISGGTPGNAAIRRNTNTFGIWTETNGNVELRGDFIVGEVNGNYGNGYVAYGKDSGTEVSIAGKTTVESVSGATSAQVLHAENGAQITLGNGLEVNAVNSSGGNATVLTSKDTDSSVVVSGEIKVNEISGDTKASGIRSVDGGEVIIKDQVEFGEIASAAGDAVGVESTNGGTVDLEKGLIMTQVEGAGKSQAFSATGVDSTIQVNRSRSGIVKVVGDTEAVGQGKVSIHLETNDSYLTGNIYAESNGEASLEMTSGTFTGNIDRTNGGAVSEGTVRVQMSGDSVWNMTDSWKGDLKMNGGGELRFYDNDPSSYMSVVGDGWVEINDGTIHFETDIGALQGDQFTAAQGITGSGGLANVDNNGSSATNGTERLELILDKNYQGTDFTLTHLVDQGGYTYQLYHEDSNQERIWYLAALSDSDKSRPTPSNPANAGPSLIGGGYLLNYAETQTLIKRLGDLREGKEEGNVWVRSYGGKFETSGDGFLRGFDMDYWGIQAGIDKKVERKDGKGTVYVGGMLGYSKGNLDFNGSGSGSVDSKTVGAYWTHISPNGFYADAVFKYGWMKNDYYVRDSAGQSVIAKDIDTNGFSGSLELGRRYHFDRKEKQGFYIEPQTQITVSHQNGATFTASNGLRTKVDGYRSVLGRIGTHIGYEVKKGNNPVNVYVKWDWVKEFDGEMGFSLNGSKESTSYKGSWHVWGVGATAQIGKKHNLYLEVEKASGGKFTQSWGINGGYRFSW